MKTAKRAFNKFYTNEENGKYELTYLIWETTDELTSDILSEDNKELARQKLDWLYTLVINEGVTQARKEMTLTGLGIAVGIGIIYGVNKLIKRNFSKELVKQFEEYTKENEA
jgi:hypothetical protein